MVECESDEFIMRVQFLPSLPKKRKGKFYIMSDAFVEILTPENIVPIIDRVFKELASKKGTFFDIIQIFDWQMFSEYLEKNNLGYEIFLSQDKRQFSREHSEKYGKILKEKLKIYFGVDEKYMIKITKNMTVKEYFEIKNEWRDLTWE